MRQLTTVVNIRTDAYDVYIGRSGKGKDGYFGNPFRVIDYGGSHGVTLNHYERYFYSRLLRDKEFEKRILELAGLKLGCFCKPKPCHGDIIAYYLNFIQ